MKDTDTHKVVLPTGDISGKATTLAFAQVMNLLIRILTKLGLPVFVRAGAKLERFRARHEGRPGFLKTL
jgi:hypothetical protein